MVVLEIQEYDPEFVQCSGCGVTFQVVWQRDAFHTQVEYCPFCGEEVEGVE